MVCAWGSGAACLGLGLAGGGAAGRGGVGGGRHWRWEREEEVVVVVRCARERGPNFWKREGIEREECTDWKVTHRWLCEVVAVLLRTHSSRVCLA